jgi:copper homeostasis protein
VPDEVLVEICCGSVEDALHAQEGGADRVELCSALCVGGLTPSLGTILEAEALVKVPVMVMIRPRAAGFHFRDSEISVMERDTRAAVEAGAEGVVFGTLRADGSVDEAACGRLRRAADGREAVFHRAFDATPDPFRALEQLIGLGITRVLTSGQRASALEGSATLGRLIERARGRIEILPGGGIRAGNVQEIVRTTGCRQVHLSAFAPASDPSTAARPEISFLSNHLPPDQYAQTDPERVRDVVRALAQDFRVVREIPR